VRLQDDKADKGTLTIQIEDPDGALRWCVSLAQDAGDMVSIQVGQAGRHAIVVQGNGTAGSFDLSWEVEQAGGGGR
jgi:hypothetical protein